MLFDMDAELQHLISLSMDKMTSGASSSTTGRGGRKSRGMDLRKALLVAHFLQDVRCAYLEEDYEIVANTIKDLKPYHCEKENKITKEDEKQDLNKDLNKRCTEESRTYFMDTDSDIPSSSMHQSCVTNSDLMVSRISQVTQPLAISVNTSYVMSHQFGLKEEKEETCIEDEVPAFCEELEVVCEDASYSSDVATSQSPDITSQQRDDSYNISGAFKRCESLAEVMTTTQNSLLKREKRTEGAVQKNESEKLVKPRTITCPLPKKKRPLPKEYWDADCQPSPALKAPRISFDTQTTESCKVSRSWFVTNSCTTTIANTVTLESKTSTSLSTVCSVMGTSTVPTTRTPGKLQSNPKVVVQITQSCDSYLPITHSKICLEKRLSEMTARAL